MRWWRCCYGAGYGVEAGEGVGQVGIEDCGEGCGSGVDEFDACEKLKNVWYE